MQGKGIRGQKTKGNEIELIPATRGRNVQNYKYPKFLYREPKR